MEERDIQIRSFRVRMPAGPDDGLLAPIPRTTPAAATSSRPLKDRIDSQIITHYPRTPEAAMAITAQEAWLDRPGSGAQARDPAPWCAGWWSASPSRRARTRTTWIRRAGVSARLPIAALELLYSAVELRGALTGEARPARPALGPGKRGARRHRQAGAGLCRRAGRPGQDRPGHDRQGGARRIPGPLPGSRTTRRRSCPRTIPTTRSSPGSRRAIP